MHWSIAGLLQELQSAVEYEGGTMTIEPIAYIDSPELQVEVTSPSGQRFSFAVSIEEDEAQGR